MISFLKQTTKIQTFRETPMIHEPAVVEVKMTLPIYLIQVSRRGAYCDTLHPLFSMVLTLASTRRTGVGSGGKPMDHVAKYFKMANSMRPRFLLFRCSTMRRPKSTIFTPFFPCNSATLLEDPRQHGASVIQNEKRETDQNQSQDPLTSACCGECFENACQFHAPLLYQRHALKRRFQTAPKAPFRTR